MRQSIQSNSNDMWYRAFSLATKNALVYLFLILSSSIFIGLIVYKLSQRFVLSNSEQSIHHTGILMRQKIDGYLENVRQDIRYLSRSPTIFNYIQGWSSSHSVERKSLVQTEFEALLTAKPYYSQLRLIGKEQGGKEQIRVDRVDSLIRIYKDNELQVKGERNYYTESTLLKEGEIYFSEIDLNKEYNQITLPRTPTIRAASPLYLDGILFGIVIINVDLRGLFAELKQMTRGEFHLFLINSRGDFLIHPDSAKAFAFEYGLSASINDLIPAFLIDGSVNSKYENAESRYLDKDFFYNLTKLESFRANYNCYSVIQVEKASLLKDFTLWKWEVLALGLFGVMIFMGIAWWWMRKQASELNAITDDIVEYSKSYEINGNIINRQDEIGILSRKFVELTQKINQNMASITLAKKEAQDANAAKQEFIENFSHEIRNPVHSIMGLVDVLSKNQPRQDQSSLLRTIQFSTQQLQALVSDVLEYTKVRNKQIHLRPQWVNLKDLLEDLVKSYLFFASEKQIKISLESDGLDSKIWVWIDQLRVYQVLANLIQNAIKFTPPKGSVKLICRVKDEHSFVFIVKDSGPGILEKDLVRIFNRHEYLDTDNNILFKSSTGLGLSIVTGLLDLMSSKVKVYSEVNQGSEFLFELILDWQRRENQVFPKGSNDLTFIQKNVLCIDDDVIQLEAYKYQLSDKFKKVVCLDSFPVEWNEEEWKRIDLIITDYKIGQMNISELAEGSNTAIYKELDWILVSGFDIDQLPETLTFKFKFKFQKPVRIQEVLDQLRQLYIENLWEEPQWYDFTIDYDNNPALIKNAMNSVVTEWEKTALDLMQAIKDGNSEALVNLEHRMVNSFRKFHLNQLHGLLLRIMETIKHGQEAQSMRMELETRINYILECMRQYRNDIIV